MSKLEVAEFLHAEHRLKGNVVEFEIDELEFFIVFKGPGYAADVFIRRDNGRYSIAETTADAMAVLNDPHKGRDSGKAWLWLIDISAVVMLLMSISRFGLLLYIKKRRNPGLLAAFQAPLHSLSSGGFGCLGHVSVSIYQAKPRRSWRAGIWRLKIRQRKRG